ncbi:MAG TPA: sigma-70 family RNA polymerase sigma factor [Blastocatellia bacterium]|jgi:RNA polymerase sigma factor (TIGR02999 family)
MDSTGTVTQLLLRWNNGDKMALDDLIPLVYAELRRIAGAYLRREDRDHTMQPTALVHEAYLKLVDQRKVNWKSRAQFFGVAAKLMRNILVDHAREQKAAKRGGNQYLMTLTSADRIGSTPDLDLIALDEALNSLAEIRPQHSRIVELKFFGGLTIEEIAEVMEISHATVEREWSFARAWLRRELSR